ncbi:guanylate cyclase 2G-like [Saccoglossus kowalevskii]|uniref:Guanylate cyclase 2G-like n=1 Tax=Saccoglossus kowalevskii TaxID=10224 RepID=A0ABM0GX07_SACKO|nr:PREDICTED: guanylate cyclase 2G-like [Saccoglossus kowalevskii]
MQVFASTLIGQNKKLLRERQRACSLLYRLLPKAVANQLKKNEKVTAESYDMATVFFSDIVGFTSICSLSSPLQVVRMLNSLYSLFDQRIGQYDVYKVETIGDAYMVVSGVPLRNGKQHVGEIASLSLDLQYNISKLEIPHLPGTTLKLRIGIHTGKVVAGIVGTKMPRYCLFGETVNIAERIENAGLPDRIHVSKHSHDLLTEIGGYYMSERGIMDFEGKGQFKTYWLNGKDGFEPENAFDATPNINVPSLCN